MLASGDEWSGHGYIELLGWRLQIGLLLVYMS